MSENIPQDIAPNLADAFSAFTNSAMMLNDAYKSLEEQLERMSLELEEKNRQLNESLREKERLHNYLRCVLESMNSGIISVNTDGKVTMFNKTAQNLLGRNAEEAIGLKIEEVFQQKYHCELLGVANVAKQTETEAIHSNSRDGFEYLLDTLNTFSPHLEEITINSSKEPLNIEISTTVIRDDNNHVLGALEVLRDLTEWRRLEEQLQRSKTLAALGEMSVSIAHDMRNPLAAIQLFAETLQNGELSKDERHRIAEDIITGVTSMNATVSNLLSFTRPIKLRLRVVNLARLLDEALFFTEHTIRESNIKIIKNYPEWGLNCEVDREQLKQIISNLVINAIQAMPNGGELSISAKLCTWNIPTKTGKSPQENENHSSFPNSRDGAIYPDKDGAYIDLRFKDTGCGISKDLQEKIFLPFVTTKERGVGLGLSIVHRIVEAHSATVDIESEEGIGTSFIIRLPVEQNPESRKAGKPESQQKM